MATPNTSSKPAKRLIPREPNTPITQAPRFTAADKAKLNSIPFGGGPSGPPGPQGPIGCPGPQGPIGPIGPQATITVKEEGVIVSTGVGVLDFSGHVEVFPDSTGEVDIEVPLLIDGGTF